MAFDKERRVALVQLASRHAALRWTRKQRNAELRSLGYDPEGEDGQVYRGAFLAACAGELRSKGVSEELA